MSKRLNILESKKLFKEFNYLLSDIDFKNEFQREYGGAFERELRRVLREEPIFKQACKEKFGLGATGNTETINEIGGEANRETDEPEDSTDIVVFTGSTMANEPIIKVDMDDQKLKHLYRKIVQKTHPDKIKSESLNELYVKSTDAKKSGDILTIYSICNELKIKFNINDKEIAILKKQINFIKSQQRIFEGSHLWLWVHTNNEKRKKEIIKHFLLHNAPAVAILF